MVDDLTYHIYFGHPLELPVTLAIATGLFLLIRATDPTRSRALIAAASCLAAGPISWLFGARLTQRLLPPVSVYLVMLGMLLGSIGFAADARYAIWLRVMMAAVLAAVLALLLRAWVGPMPGFLD